MITDRIRPGLGQTSLNAGFNHHLVKPASFEDLQQILATVPPADKIPAK